MVKSILILIAWLLSVSLELSGQIKFESNSATTELSYERIIGKPKFDSVQFVFRFWQSTEHVPGILLELRLQNDGHWKYRRGYVNTKKKIFVSRTKKFDLQGQSHRSRTSFFQTVLQWLLRTKM